MLTEPARKHANNASEVLLASNSGKRAGTICHDNPYLSLSQPQSC
jgi:hypothetical protein